MTSYSRIPQLPPSDFVPFAAWIATWGDSVCRISSHTHAAYAYRVYGILACCISRNAYMAQVTACTNKAVNQWREAKRLIGSKFTIPIGLLTGNAIYKWMWNCEGYYSWANIRTYYVRIIKIIDNNNMHAIHSRPTSNDTGGQITRSTRGRRFVSEMCSDEYAPTPTTLAVIQKKSKCEDKKTYFVFQYVYTKNDFFFCYLNRYLRSLKKKPTVYGLLGVQNVSMIIIMITCMVLMIEGILYAKPRYSGTPDERPPSPTTIPLIRPHFVWRTAVSVRIRIPHERPSLLYDHTNVILRVVV